MLMIFEGMIFHPFWKEELLYFQHMKLIGNQIGEKYVQKI